MKKTLSLLFTTLILLNLSCALQSNDLEDSASMNVKSLAGEQSPVELYSAECLTTYNLSYGRFGSAHIYVDVENIAYHKNVEIWYSVDGAEWQSASCHYQDSLGNNRERWFTYIQLYQYSADYPTMDIQFALKYTVNGVTYWDNNQGRDYHMTIRRFLTGGSHPTFLLGNSQQIRLLNYSYTTNSQGRAIFRSQAIVKNLTYRKFISLTYSSDDWNKIAAAGYHYQSTTASGEEIWETDFILVDSPDSFEFYLHYYADGQVYLDDNDERYYTLHLGNQWWHGRN